jgi:hypothetical protein
MIEFDLRSWLADRGYTVKGAARGLGLSRTTLTKYRDTGQVPRTVWMAIRDLDAIRQRIGERGD